MTHLGNVELGSSISIFVNTHDPLTGAAKSATANPDFLVFDGSGTLIMDGEMAAAWDTGLYLGVLAVTAAAGFAAGRMYCARIEATVNTENGDVTAADVQTFWVVEADDTPTAMILPAEEEA